MPSYPSVLQGIFEFILTKLYFSVACLYVDLDFCLSVTCIRNDVLLVILVIVFPSEVLDDDRVVHIKIEHADLEARHIAMVCLKIVVQLKIVASYQIE